MTTETKHLWECDHDYYCNEEAYSGLPKQETYRSWSEYLAEWGDADLDYNLVFRWDWTWKGERTSPPEDRYMREGTLKIFIVGQRKGKFLSVAVDVCMADEPAIIEHLKPRMAKLMGLWAPLSLEEA